MCGLFLRTIESLLVKIGPLVGAEGEKIPRKGGPGITKSDLLVINKIDLAPYVGADLSVMEADTNRMRPEKPWVFANLKEGKGLPEIIEFIRHHGMLD